MLTYCHKRHVISGPGPVLDARAFQVPIPKVSLVPRPPSEKSRKGLATRMAMRCPRGLYTRAIQIAEISNVTFNRGCANSLV